MRDLIAHILTTGYDEVVVVDFPGFNLRLIRKLKQKNPDLRITYVSPPQMWVWGAWRVKKIRQYVDRVIVLYPFEVAWYAQRGVQAEWMGSPVVRALDAQCQKEGLAVPLKKRSFQIALLPGSRRQEITQLMAVYAPVLKQLCKEHPGLTIAIVVAPTLSQERIAHALAPHQPETWGGAIRYVTEADEALRVRAESICALTKPGTNTLELALLGVPTVVVYKTSWLTYWLARMVVKVDSMTLPNLLLKEPVFPEFIQDQCTTEKVVAQLHEYLEQHKQSSTAYEAVVENVMRVRSELTR
jgi:lipid-A-disaccharide synthase